jgi:hypothetical protein
MHLLRISTPTSLEEKLSYLLYALLVPLACIPSVSAQAVPNGTNVTVRLGRSYVALAPGSSADNAFNAILLQDGTTFRGFVANDYTYYLDSTNLESLPTPSNSLRVSGLGPGVSGTYNACGEWLNSTDKVGGVTVNGFYHAEGPCSHKSMGYARSVDQGKTWTDYGQIISGTDPANSYATGIGD